MEVLLRNHSAQSPATSARWTSPRYILGYCKVKCNLYDGVQKVWWSLYWVLRPSWAGGMWLVAVLLNTGVFQMRRCCSATTEHTALPVCD